MSNVDVDDLLNLENEFPVQHRIWILAAQLNAAAGLGTWCFVEDGSQPADHLVFSTCLKEKEFLSFLKLGKCMDYLKGKEGGWDKPVILSDALGLTWVAEHAYVDGNPDLLIMLGPCFLSSTSRKYIENALCMKISSTQTRLQMTRTLMEVPVISPAVADQYCKLFHYMLTSQRISASEFILQHREAAKAAEDEDDTYFMNDSDRVIEGEQHFLTAVREGNLKYREILETERLYNDEFVCETGDPLRDAKNSVIVFTVLCGRAALDGGLSASLMRELEKQYLLRIEKCRTTSELRKIKDEMLEEYVTRVRQSQDSALVSKSIRDCCDYIRINVTRPLTVQEIASHVGYTTYYFTKKFNKEMGIKVTDYIKQARIEYAKVALLTTNQSIQEISDRLQFGSRNYFSKVFRSVVGMTPAAYRDSLGKAQSQQE